MAKPSQLKPKFKEELKKGKTIKETVKPFGEAAIKEFQKQISPEGMAKFQADAKKALEDKYPNMFVPETRTTAGIHRAR